jgi:hypothetical protein
MKQLVWTNLANTNIAKLWQLSSEVEGEVRTSYGDKDEVEVDDEREDDDGNLHEEAPNNPDILI